MRELISGAWWPSCHARLLGGKGSQLGLIPEELLFLSSESHPFCALKPCSGLTPNLKHTYLSPSRQCLFCAQPSTEVSVPPSLSQNPHPPPVLHSSCLATLPATCSSDSGQPGLATSCNPSYPTYSSQSTQSANYSHSMQLSGSSVSSPSLMLVLLQKNS